MDLLGKMPEQQAAELTKSGFAKLIDVTPGRVSHLIADGLPVLPTGRVPRDAGLAWYRANVRQKVEGAQTEAHELARVKIERESAQRDLLVIDVAKRRGDLIDRREVELAIHDRAQGERDAHMAWVSRMAPQIASEVGADLGALFAALDREMRAHLVELADTPLPELLTHG